jgi:fructokinase
VIIVCGEALVDLVAAPDTIMAQLGGAPFNVAIGLARLGIPVSFFGGISSDAIGTTLLQALKREGVRTEFVQVSPSPSMIAIAGISATGVASYSFPDLDSADKALPPSELALRSKAGINCAVFGSYLAFHPRTKPVLLGLARDLSPDAVICLDPNVRLPLIPDPNVWIEGVEEFLPFVDILKCSEEDITNMYGGSASASDIARKWLRRGPSLVCVTRGEHGATAYSRDGMVLDLPAPKVQVIDTIGAGDSFLAALLASLAQAGILHKKAAFEGALLDQALKFAIAAAAITCQRDGANLPSLQDIQVP